MISIIIPVFNQPQAFTRAIDSIAKQTDRDIEVIVVDDGSKPALAYYATGLSYKVIRQENQGAPAARNKGCQEARGDYVIFWDADVVAEPRMLEQLQNALQMHPEASYAYCHHYFGAKKMPARAFDAPALRQTNYIHTTSLIRRADLPAQGWDESLKRFQDWDMWLTMLDNNKIGQLVPEYLFRVVPHQGGMSQWLPSFSYQPPFKYLPGLRLRVKRYEDAAKIVRRKHGL